MAFLVTFHWGWVLASLLLGIAMGWIAVVHRGQGVSKLISRWLAVLVAALVAAAFAPVYAFFLFGVSAALPAVIFMSALLVWRHKANILNLAAGKESRIGAKKEHGSAIGNGGSP